MGRSKEELRKYGRFHQADPSELGSLDELAEWLESILHNPCSVWDEDGDEFLIEIRQLVIRLSGLKIEVYSNEHPPPHFHVKSPNVNASFTIESCEKLEGDIASQDYKKVRFWHKHAKQKLIEAWNESRPTECVVGKYRGA